MTNALDDHEQWRELIREWNQLRKENEQLRERMLGKLLGVQEEDSSEK